MLGKLHTKRSRKLLQQRSDCAQALVASLLAFKIKPNRMGKSQWQRGVGGLRLVTLLHSSLTVPARFSLETAVSDLQALINDDKYRIVLLSSFQFFRVVHTNF